MQRLQLSAVLLLATLAMTRAEGADPLVSRAAAPAAGQRSLSFQPISGRPGAWSADNDAQHLRILLSTEGIQVLSSSPAKPTWEWRTCLAQDGEPGDLRDSEYPTILVQEGRAEIQRGRVDEWVRNGPAGLEHGIEIRRRGGSGVLHFDFALAGSLFPKVSEDGRSVEFRDGGGALALAYRDLSGADAEGRDVGARWERLEGRPGAGSDLRLIVHEAEHAFPIVVTALLVASEDLLRAPAARPSTTTEAGTLAAPSNDQCEAAQVIAGAGPFPHLSATVDITDAGTIGDPPTPSCQTNVSRSVWFAFTPVTTTDYTFSVCSGEPTATTVEDTVLGVYEAAGSCAGLTEMTGGCDDDSCPVSAQQSMISNIRLNAGSTYYIVAWKYGATPPAPGAGDLQLNVAQSPPSGPAPDNDLCSAAEPIPADGPFPYLSAVTANVGGATTTGDPAAPSCQPNVSRSIWYSFTPAVDGRYALSTCADAPTGTTADDTVIAVFMGDCSSQTQVAAACDDDSCSSEAAQSVIQGVSLAAGTAYHIGVWQYGALAPLPGNTAVQLRVNRLVAPPNDTCASAALLSLHTPVRGTTVSALDDTQLPTGSGCFTGIGQTPSTASGADVVYRFSAPAPGKYSFRLSNDDTSKNAVLYVASDCPAASSPATITGCLEAANRNVVNPEEVTCLPLSNGETVYVYPDEHAATTTGTAFTLEVSRCEEEVEPDDLPGAAAELFCGVEGSIVPAGDADFFTLGIAGAGSRLFALVDGAAGNSTDFDLRVTTNADTLEYDDLNNDVPFGVVSPNASGTPLAGTATYLRVSHYSAMAQAEPYRLYAAIQPDAASATPELEPNNTVAVATGGANEYYSGVLSDANDVDIFSFSATAGESIQIGLDLDPLRDATPFNGSLALLDASGTTLRSVNDLSQSSSTVPGSGTLTATTPGSPGEGIVHRIGSSGTHFVRVAGSSGTPRDYLLSVAHDCRVGPSTNLALSQSDTPDPAPPGGVVTYSVTVRNLGASPASVIRVRDDLPAGVSLLSAVPSQGSCAGAGPVICDLGTLTAGASATVTVAVRAAGTAGTITNLVRAATAVIDLVAADDASSETTQVGSLPDSDGDGVADSADCAPADGTVWAVPDAATGLGFPAAVDPTLLQWSPPSRPGGTIVQYDLLRSTSANGFDAAGCVASDIAFTYASDPGLPGAIYYYLVRPENLCGGSLGSGSFGAPRIGRSCP